MSLIARGMEPDEVKFRAVKISNKIGKIALTMTLTLALYCGAFAQARLPVPSPFLDGGSMGGFVSLDDLALVNADELLKTRGGPTRLTIKAQKVLLSELLPQISEQTGLPFRVSQYDAILNRVRLSPDIEGASFWRAMRELLTPVEGRFGRAFSPDGLFVNSGEPLLPGRASEIGPLFLAAERIENQSSLLLDPKAANLARESKLTLVLNVGYEPRLLAEPAMTHCRILEARDDTGAALSLVTANEAPDIGVQTSNWNTTQLRLPLSGLGANARKLSVVRGVISVPVWGGADTWEVNDLQNLPQEKTMGEQTFRLEKVGKERDNDRIEAVVTIPGRAAFGSGTAAMSLFDEAGRELPSNGQGGGQDSEGTRTQRFYFQGEPATSVLRVRHSLRRIEVPWELRDLPLP